MWSGCVFCSQLGLPVSFLPWRVRTLLLSEYSKFRVSALVCWRCRYHSWHAGGEGRCFQCGALVTFSSSMNQTKAEVLSAHLCSCGLPSSHTLTSAVPCFGFWKVLMSLSKVILESRERGMNLFPARYSCLSVSMGSPPECWYLGHSLPCLHGNPSVSV